MPDHDPPPDRTSGVSCLAVAATLLQAGATRGCFFLCPFHNDTKPSMRVFNDDTGGHFHCYGCGAHGDQVSLVMRMQDSSFVLAQSWIRMHVLPTAWIDLPDIGSADAPQKAQTTTEQAAASRALTALQFSYQKTLQHAIREGGCSFGRQAGGLLGEFIRQYVSGSTNPYCLGYCPDIPVSMVWAGIPPERARIHVKHLVACRALYEGGRGFLHGRITIGLSHRGPTFGLTGRATDPKAIKRWLIAGMKGRRWPEPFLYFPASNDVTAKARKVVVLAEGYGDAIWLSHAGCPVAGAFGTARPPRGLSDWLRERGILHVIHLPDGDKAGLDQIPALAEIADKAHAQYSAIIPHDGLDPADMLQDYDLPQCLLFPTPRHDTVIRPAGGSFNWTDEIPVHEGVIK